MKLAVEVVINVGVQLLFRVGGGGWVDCGRIKLNVYIYQLIELKVEVVFEVWLKIVLKINFHGWVVGNII